MRCIASIDCETNRVLHTVLGTPYSVLFHESF
jgi:hypothetical protein